jgi:sulfite reductase (ferredoxin)
MHIDDLETTLEPVFIYFKQSRQAGERFGDFCDRVGLDAIHQFVASYEPSIISAVETLPEETVPETNGKTATAGTKATRVRRRVTVQEATYTRLQEAALHEGKPISQIANEAIEAYLEKLKDKDKVVYQQEPD